MINKSRRKIDGGRIVKVDAKDVRDGNDFLTNHSPPKQYKGKVLGKEIYYYNTLGEDVVIGDRSGLLQELPSAFSIREKRLVIRVTFKYSLSQVKINLDHVLHSESPEAIEIAKAFGGSQKHLGSEEFSVVYSIYPSDLQKNGGCIYLRELDIMIGTLPAGMMPYHPYSERGSEYSIASNIRLDIPGGNSFFGITIVDNLGKYGDRFANINGKVIKVVPIKSMDLKDGVYITYSGVVESTGEVPKEDLGFYTLEDAKEELKNLLFHTADAAECFGDFEKQRALDAMQREYEFKLEEYRIREVGNNQKLEELQRKFDLEILKLDNNEKELSRTDELSSRKTRLALLEMERAETLGYLKDRLDAKASDRKDFSETIKIFGAVVVSVGSLIALWKKFS